jgi:serine protease AprX
MGGGGGSHEPAGGGEGPDAASTPEEERPVDLPAESDFGEPATAVPGRPLDPVPTSPDLVLDSVIARPLRERMQRDPDRPIGVVVELRNAYPGGTPAAELRVRELIVRIAGADVAAWMAGTYLATELTADQIEALARADTAGAPSASADPGVSEPAPPGPVTPEPTFRAAIHRLWPNFETGALIHRTIVTTKCQAVHRAFDGLGQDVVWAVFDSGIDAGHAHFAQHRNLDLPARLQHKSFIAGASDEDALRDGAGHGTHVAGIIAGAQVVGDGDDPFVAATWYQDERGDTEVNQLPLRAITGMAPRCKLLSCKVLRDDRTGDLAALLAALQYVQDLNDGGRDLQIHGVNLSVGYPFDPSWFAAGLTPVCREVDRLVRSGVVVVAAAGNTGYGYALGPDGNRIRMGFDLTINDPGNAELAITVGATSARPHSTGVSYFSSKGPTGDGRQKPDLVAPGERIVSAGAGAALERARARVPQATYVEDSGTSMAAPHVSGVAAALLSVHREFLGHPEEIKRILLSAATDLGRAREFQGHGLVDAMRAIQTV